MTDSKTGWDEGAATARIEDLDGEDLDIEKLLEIEGEIEEKIENYAVKAQDISGNLLGEKLPFRKKKLLSEAKAALAGVLESLLAQRDKMRSQLRDRGYGREGSAGD